KALPKGLNEEIAEGGSNLSLGQCQLLCIARALLRRCKVLVMDEATSAIDPETDKIIQNVLRDGNLQEGTTVLTIAHRLDTIVDYDKIMVLKDGEVLEYDTPSTLLANQESTFYSMYKEFTQE